MKSKARFQSTGVTFSSWQASMCKDNWQFSIGDTCCFSIFWFYSSLDEESIQELVRSFV